MLLKDQVSALLAPGLSASKQLQRTPHDVHDRASPRLWSCLHPPAVTGGFVVVRMKLQVSERGRGSCCFRCLWGQLERVSCGGGEGCGGGRGDGQSHMGEMGAPGLCPAPTSPVPWPDRWANSSSVPSVCFVPLLAPLIYIGHQYDNYIHLQI